MRALSAPVIGPSVFPGPIPPVKVCGGHLGAAVLPCV